MRRRTSRKTRAGGFVALALALVPARARADNTESFFYSDDAAMTAGAVGAVTRDTGAIWYQPAGLGGIKRGSIDLSGSVFGLRIRTVDNALTTAFPGSTRSITLESKDIFSAPHALGFVRHLSDTVSVGAGLYVTYRDIRTAEVEQEVQGPALGDPTVQGTYRHRLDIAVDQTRYHLGPAIGWEIVPGFRVGASLFGTYGKSNGFLQFLVGQQATLANGASSTFLVLGQSRVAFSYFGMQAQIGAQWDVDEDWSLSLLARSPEMLLSSSAEGVTLETTALVVPANAPIASFALSRPNGDLGAFTAITAPRFIAGVARRLGERSWVSAEVDVQAPVSNDIIDQKTVVNGRLGARIRVNDTFSFGAGLYTDLAPQKKVGDVFGDERVDEVGGTFGVELRTPLSLKEKPEPDALVLSTTLAVKYGLGLGEFRASDVDLINSGNPPPRTVDVVYHTIVPYVGSSILF